MANAKISELPAAGAITGAELAVVVQSGTTSQTTIDDILTGITLTDADLGTPTAGNLSNCTDLPIVNGTTGTLSVARGGTGITAFGTGVATALGQNVSGSGSIAMTTSPTFVTPTLGAASATSINKVAITAPGTGATLTIANNKTLTVNNILTFAGTDSTTMTFPTTSATIARTDAANTFTGNQTFSGAIIGSVQNLGGAGAVNVTTGTTAYTSAGAAEALTLADGTAGQFKTIVYVAEAAGGDSGVLTPTNFGNGTSITFAAVGDSVMLQFLGTDWWVVSINGATIA